MAQRARKASVLFCARKLCIYLLLGQCRLVLAVFAKLAAAELARVSRRLRAVAATGCAGAARDLRIHAPDGGHSDVADPQMTGALP